MNAFKSPVETGLFILVLFSLTACPSRSPKVSSQPVVQVNDQPLTTKEFATRLGRRLKDVDAVTAKNPVTIESAKAEILKNFITRSLVVDWARSKNMKISDQDLDKEVEKLRAGYPDDLAFRRALASDDLSFSEWRENLRYSLLEKMFFAKLDEDIKPPTEDEIKGYFSDHRDQYRKKDRIYLRQIVVDEEAKADLMKSELAKKHDFADLAQKYSNAPEAKSGGIVGWIEKGSVDFFDSAFSLPIGKVSNVIHSPFGYHLLRVDKKLPASTGTLDEARPSIVRALRAQREQGLFVAWMDGQIRSAKIEKNDELIRSIKVETRSRDD